MTPGSLTGERVTEIEKGRQPAQGVVLSNAGNWSAVPWRTSERQQRSHTLVTSPMVRELGYLTPRAHKP